MILGVDWGPLTLGSSGGIVQWVQGVISAYIDAYPEDELLMFMPEQVPLRFGSSEKIRYYTANRRALVDLTGKVLKENRADLLIRSYPALESPEFPVERQIVIVPDMQHADRPQFFNQKQLRQRRLAFGYLLANAGAIGTMTEFSRSSIRAYPWTNCKDVFLMPPGVRFDAARRQQPALTDGWARRLARFSGFFFMPANPWPHKNHRNLFEAFSRALPSLPAGTGLVLTGAGSGWSELLRGYEHLPIEHLGYLSEEHLPALYRRALALTFFSSYEGFGMPLLEAFHFGTPVICSDIPALVEVGGDAVLAAPPNDPKRMAEVMVQVAADPGLRRQMVEKGGLRLAQYTFPDSAARLRDAATRVLERAGSGARRRSSRLKISALLDLSDPGAKAAGAPDALLRQGYDDFDVIPFGAPVPADVANDPRIRMPEGGPLVSPGRAAAQATGEIVVLVRGDCRLDPSALASIAAHFAEHAECDMVVVPTMVEIGGRERKPGWEMPLAEAEVELSFADRRLLPTLSFERRLLKDVGRDFRGSRPVIAWRRRIAALAGTFDDALAYAYDADYTLRLVEAGGALRILPDPLATIAISADPSAARYWYLVMTDLQKIIGQRRGRLRGRFFRLYRHRQHGLEPVATRKWDLFLSLRAWGERPIWSARRRLAKASSRAPLLSGAPPVA